VAHVRRPHLRFGPAHRRTEGGARAVAIAQLLLGQPDQIEQGGRFVVALRHRRHARVHFERGRAERHDLREPALPVHREAGVNREHGRLALTARGGLGGGDRLDGQHGHGRLDGRHDSGGRLGGRPGRADGRSDRRRALYNSWCGRFSATPVTTAWRAAGPMRGRGTPRWRRCRDRFGCVGGRRRLDGRGYRRRGLDRRGDFDDRLDALDESRR